MGKRLDKFTDSMLSLISPKRAMVRQHLRRMARDTEYREVWLAMLRARGYRNAKASGSKTPWLGTSGSADVEISADLPALRNRARELNRDDPIGAGLTRTFTNNVIGTGIRAQARTDRPAVNDALEAVWRERKDRLYQSDRLTHIEAQRLIFRKWFEDGDVGVKVTKAQPNEPVWFEVIEAERIATPNDKTKTGDIRDGVERDAAGRVVAYHITKDHPGESVAALTLKNTEMIRVDAALFRLLKTTDRPGQSRGVPWCHAILQDLRDLDLLLLASLKRVQIAACLAVFIESPDSVATILESTEETYGHTLDQPIEPGMIFKSYPGEKINTLIPNFPTPELQPFIIMLARRIGAALGVSWQVVLKDFSQSTYSSARTDLLESRIAYLVPRTAFIENLLNWEWQTVMQDARMMGDPRVSKLTDADLSAVHWIAPGWKWVDPVKEAQGKQIELQMGITTLRDICAENGTDWEEIQAQRIREEAREAELRAAAGLPLKTPEPETDTPEDTE